MATTLRFAHLREWLLFAAYFCGTSCALAATSADFWKKKPPGQWTAEQALKVLQHSPWSKELRVIVNLPMRASAHRGGLGSKDPFPQRPIRTQRPIRQPGEFPNETLPEAQNQAAYLIRWESAAAVIGAFRRLEELEMRSSARLQSPPPRRPDDRYVITLKTTRPAEPEPEPLAGLSEPELKQRAHLKTRWARVQASEVERSGVGLSAAVHFFFPRTLDGQPLLAGDHRQASFHLKTQRVTLKTKFALQE